MEDVIPTWIADLSVIPLIIIVGWLIATGRLVPSKTVTALIERADKAILDKDAIIDSQRRQIELMLDGSRTTVHALESVKEAATRDDRTSGSTEVRHVPTTP